MTNLKNIIFEQQQDTMYSALIKIVACAGLESVLLSLSEITSDLYLQKMGDVTNNITERIFFINGKEYIVPILEYKDR